MRNTFIIGIDIGKSGAICILDDGKMSTHKMPMTGTELDYNALFRLIEPFRGRVGIIAFEHLGVIYGSSKTTAFSMGHQLGAVEMLCTSLHIPYTKVRAKDWQKEMFQGVDEISRAHKLPGNDGYKPVRDTKAMALVAIKRLFPDLKLTFGEKAKKPDDGLIDAVLITEYARRKFN
jgi:hypothetical protein